MGNYFEGNYYFSGSSRETVYDGNRVNEFSLPSMIVSMDFTAIVGVVGPSTIKHE